MFNDTFFSKPYNQLLATLTLVGIVCALASYAYVTLVQADHIGSEPATISVSGTGEVLAKPDIAQFSFSVRGQGVDAAAAQTTSATAINEIMDYLKSQKIDEKDIRTEGYNLYPKYRSEERICPFGSYCPPTEGVIDGYEVIQTITVKVRAIDTAGTLLAGVGERGATDLSGLNFTIDDEEVLQTEARDLAIKDAEAKADELAAALGVKLVRLVGYSEGMSGVPYYGGFKLAEMDASESGQAVPAPAVPTGENMTTSQVTLTFQVK